MEGFNLFWTTPIWERIIRSAGNPEIYTSCFPQWANCLQSSLETQLDFYLHMSCFFVESDRLDAKWALAEVAQFQIALTFAHMGLEPL